MGLIDATGDESGTQRGKRIALTVDGIIEQLALPGIARRDEGLADEFRSADACRRDA